MAWFYQWFELLPQLSLSRNSLTEEDLGSSDLFRRYFQGKLERETGQGRRQAKQGRGFRQCPSWPHLEPKGELWGILNPLRALPEAKNLDYLVWYQLDFYLVPCASLLCSDSKESAAGDLEFLVGLGRSPGEGNAYPLPYLAWRIPWTEEPHRLQPTAEGLTLFTQ